MNNASIVIIEDSEQLREAATIYLETRGHKIVGEAATLATALVMVDSFADNNIVPDVIVLDGNLTPNIDTGADARQIMQRITERGIASAVLGFSEGSMADYGVDVTVDVGKSLRALNSAIAEL